MSDQSELALLSVGAKQGPKAKELTLHIHSNNARSDQKGMHVAQVVGGSINTNWGGVVSYK